MDIKIRVIVEGEGQAEKQLDQLGKKTREKSKTQAKGISANFKEAAKEIAQDFARAGGTAGQALSKLAGSSGIAAAAVLGIGFAFFTMAQRAAEATASTNKESQQFLATIEKIKTLFFGVAETVGSVLVPAFNALFDAIGLAATEQERLTQQQKSYGDEVVRVANISKEYFSEVAKFRSADSIAQRTINQLALEHQQLTVAARTATAQQLETIKERQVAIEETVAGLIEVDKVEKQIIKTENAVAEETRKVAEVTRTDLIPAVRDAHNFRFTGLSLIREEAQQIQNISAQQEIANGIMAQGVANLAEGIGAAVVGFTRLSDVAKNVGRVIAQQLVTELIRATLQATILKAVLGALTGGVGGIFSGILGGLGALFGFEHGAIIAAQHGTIVRGPTIARLGEGGQPEAVVPLGSSATAQADRERIMSQAGLAGGSTINISANTIDELFVRTRLVPLLNAEAQRGTPVYSSRSTSRQSVRRGT